MLKSVIDIVKDSGIVYDIDKGIDIDELLKINMPLFADCNLCTLRNLTVQMAQDTDTKKFVCEACCQRIYGLEIDVSPF